MWKKGAVAGRIINCLFERPGKRKIRLQQDTGTDSGFIPLYPWIYTLAVEYSSVIACGEVGSGIICDKSS